MLRARISLVFMMALGAVVACSSCSGEGGSGGGDTCQDVPSPPGDPQRLSETGLYADIAGKKVACNAVTYAPSHQLWSDGADKKRWFVLPKGTRIDTADMDHWRFPIGTKFFKEFSRDGRRLETRLIEHVADTGRDEDDYRASAFVWRDDESDAELARDGKKNVRGTDHDVPSRDDCFKCHKGDVGKVLGFSAVQLAGGPDVTVKWLADQGKLTVPPAAGAELGAPGDAATAGALGYLHANCGHCHNDNGLAWPDTQIVLRLSTSERDPKTTAIHRTSVGVAMQRPQNAPSPNRIVAGHPSDSGLLFRMQKRDGTREAMPPIATEKTDAQGTSLVTSWIEKL